MLVFLRHEIIFGLIFIFVFTYVKSFFFLVIIMEISGLIRRFLLTLTIKNSLIVVYGFLGFLVIEAAVSFGFLVLFSRLKGSDNFYIV